jgi:hypothetical protein
MGKGFWGKAQKIDRNDKPRRIFVVVDDNGENVKVSKLKTIRNEKPDGRNADPALLEIDKNKYNLENRSGVDKEVFGKDVEHNKLCLGKDNGIFDEAEIFILDDRDLHRAMSHVVKRHSWNARSKGKPYHKPYNKGKNNGDKK